MAKDCLSNLLATAISASFLLFPLRVIRSYNLQQALAGITITLLTTTENKFYLIFGLTFIALGILYYPLSTLYRNRLQNKIVKYLDFIKL